MAQTIVRAGSKALCSTSADDASGALGLRDKFSVREESGAEKKDLIELWTFRPSLGDDIDGNMSVLGGLLLTDGISAFMHQPYLRLRRMIISLRVTSFLKGRPAQRPDCLSKTRYPKINDLASTLWIGSPPPHRP